MTATTAQPATPIRRTASATAAAFAGKTSTTVVLGGNHGSTAHTVADVRDAVLRKIKQYRVTQDADGSLYVVGQGVSWTVR
jgi:hypothetical protein